jgi:hypothetical protein
MKEIAYHLVFFFSMYNSYENTASQNPGVTFSTPAIMKEIPSTFCEA